MMYLYPLAMSFLGEKHCNMFNANKEFVLLYCIMSEKVPGLFGPIPIWTLRRFGPIPFPSGHFSLDRFGLILGVVVSAQFWWVVLAHFILCSF